MPKVFGMHEMNLEPEQDPEEFERFWRDEVAGQAELPGWTTHLLKADRGARAGTFLVLFEIESVEARDRFFPAPGVASEEYERFNAEHPEAAAIWEKLAGFDESDVPSDYVVVG